MFNNVRRVEYNCSACVKYRIRLMTRLHVEYNVSTCVKDWIHFGTFVCGTHGSAFVKNRYFMMCSSPIRDVRSHSLVCSENSFYILGMGPIRDK